MCGIVGYTGQCDAVETLLNGLKRLEYRGYDSAGIAVTNEQSGLQMLKTAGTVDTLEEKIQREWPTSPDQRFTSGIGHTRWATHGAPSDINAHPHLDGSGHIAVVHNGIIENHKDIHSHLEELGHTFSSETDTEVLAHLIQECYEGELLQAVCAALQKVEGAYGIAVLTDYEPEKLIVARHGSPIVLGVNDNAAMVASDAPALVTFTRRVIYLQDNDVAVVQPNDITIRNVNNVPVRREISHLDWDVTAAQKGGYEHFMLKEIYEQPESLQNTVGGRLDWDLGTAVLAGLNVTPRDIADIQRVILLACGTSLHAGLVGSFYLQDIADIPAQAEQAGEFRYRNPIITTDDLVVAVSQSGETADTLAAVREAKHKGALVSGICNVVGSSIARETERGVYLHAGPEIGVASTKAFTSQVAVMLMLALKMGRCRRLSRRHGDALCRAISTIPEAIQAVVEKDREIAEVAQKFKDLRSCFYIGRGYAYPVALEGALKLKEISYLHAEGYHAAELKHGPIALLQEDVPVVAIMTDMPGKEKTVSNVRECQARYSPVLGVRTEGDEDTADIADYEISLPDVSHYISPITTTVALQLFAYHVARLRGCDIDKPRNLAKSVTVE